MAAPNPPPESLLSHAAELRAGGLGWDAVAAKVGRAADTVRKWPALYPDRWAAALRDAERRLVGEAGAESVLVLRSLLRSDDEKVRRDAARFLLTLRLELAKLDARADAPAPPASDAARLVAFLEGHTDDELERLVADLHPPVREPGPAAPGPGDGPG